MEFSRYQNIIFDPQNECHCDKLTIPSGVFSFQTKGSRISEKVNSFDTNPNYYLLEGESIHINIPTNPLKSESRFLSFYVGNKYYIFTFDDTLTSPPSVIYNSIGDVVYCTVVSDSTPATAINRLENIINQLVNQVDGNNISVNSISNDLYLFGIDYYLIQNINIITPPTLTGGTVGLNNMYWSDGQLCFLNISGIIDNTLPTTTPSIYLPFTPVAGNYVDIKAKVINSLGYDLDYDIYFLDSSFAIIDTIPSPSPIVANGETIINLGKYVVSNIAFIELKFNDANLANELTGFCVDYFEVIEYDVLQSVSIVDCDGNTIVAPITTNTNGINSIVNIDFTGVNNCCVKVLVEDGALNIYESNPFEVIDYNALPNCLKTLQLIEWYSDCYFDKIDYLAFPFVNRLLVRGYTKRVTMASNKQTINLADGSIRKYANFTTPKRQLNIIGYGDDAMTIFERVFEHDTILINGKGYETDDVLEVVDSGGGKYNGRIDLSENDKSLISNLNCC